MAKQDCAAELIVRCFEARTQAHLWHLSAIQNSYALHVALSEFYEGIVGLTDTFAEGYQGVYGLIKSYPDAAKLDPPVGQPTPEIMLQSLRKWIMKERDDIGTPDDSELQNNIDEIVSLIDATLYKVRFLK